MPRWTFAILAMLLPLVHSNAATAKTKLDIYWKYISYEISPQQTRHESQTHEVIILDGNTVSFGNAVGNLGQAFSGNNGKPGGDYTARVTVHGGTIDAEVQFSGSRLSERIRNGGSNTCSARISYSRLRGQKFFTGNRVSNGEAMTITREEANDVYCTIVQE